MARIKLPPKVKEATRKYAEKEKERKDAVNALNREKTALRNVIKSFWSQEQLPIGSYIVSDGMEFRYEAAEHERLDADAILALFENKEITREQFLRMVNIDKTQAKNVLGGDQVAELTVKDVGKNVDVRVKPLPIEQINDEYVEVKRKVKNRRKRSVFGRKAEQARTPVEQGPKRSIKLKRSK